MVPPSNWVLAIWMPVSSSLWLDVGVSGVHVWMAVWSCLLVVPVGRACWFCGLCRRSACWTSSMGSWWFCWAVWVLVVCLGFGWSENGMSSMGRLSSDDVLSVRACGGVGSCVFLVDVSGRLSRFGSVGCVSHVDRQWSLFPCCQTLLVRPYGRASWVLTLIGSTLWSCLMGSVLCWVGHMPVRLFGCACWHWSLLDHTHRVVP